MVSSNFEWGTNSSPGGLNQITPCFHSDSLPFDAAQVMRIYHILLTVILGPFRPSFDKVMVVDY
jgi:hypothetical protein